MNVAGVAPVASLVRGRRRSRHVQGVDVALGEGSNESRRAGIGSFGGPQTAATGSPEAPRRAPMSLISACLAGAGARSRVRLASPAGLQASRPQRPPQTAVGRFVEPGFAVVWTTGRCAAPRGDWPADFRRRVAARAGRSHRPVPAAWSLGEATPAFALAGWPHRVPIRRTAAVAHRGQARASCSLPASDLCHAGTCTVRCPLHPRTTGGRALPV